MPHHCGLCCLLIAGVVLCAAHPTWAQSAEARKEALWETLNSRACNNEQRAVNALKDMKELRQETESFERNVPKDRQFYEVRKQLDRSQDFLSSVSIGLNKYIRIMKDVCQRKRPSQWSHKDEGALYEKYRATFNSALPTYRAAQEGFYQANGLYRDALRLYKEIMRPAKEPPRKQGLAN